LENQYPVQEMMTQMEQLAVQRPSQPAASSGRAGNTDNNFARTYSQLYHNMFEKVEKSFGAAVCSKRMIF
jgi:hypothetical protein